MTISIKEYSQVTAAATDILKYEYDRQNRKYIIL